MLHCFHLRPMSWHRSVGVKVYKRFDRTCFPWCASPLSSGGGKYRTSGPSTHLKREGIVSIIRLVRRPCCHIESGIL